MTVIVSVVNLTLLGCVISQFIGLKSAAKSVVRASEVMAAARQMRPAIKTEWIFEE